jgi:hypothetical protein
MAHILKFKTFPTDQSVYQQGLLKYLISFFLLEVQGSVPGRDNDRIVFSLPLCPDWFWGLPSLLFSGYPMLLPRGKAAVMSS